MRTAKAATKPAPASPQDGGSARPASRVSLAMKRNEGLMRQAAIRIRLFAELHRLLYPDPVEAVEEPT